MSTAVAIAAVTQALRNLLADGLLDDNVSNLVGDVTVSALPPDRVPLEPGNARSQLNLFLYQVSPNAALRNFDLPTRNRDGERTANTPLALNLHYLLMAYGAQELHSEILLGYGMQVLHETPMLAREDLRLALASVDPNLPPPAKPSLIAVSELADQLEVVKITPESLSTEEISRLWTAFGAKYRPSSAYTASCVLISKRSRKRPTRPVLQRNLLVTQIRRPHLDEVAPNLIEIGQTLTLRGTALAHENAVVVLSGIEIAPEAGSTDTAMSAIVPSTLSAGVTTAYVSHPVDFGSGPRRGAASNTLAFMIRPRLVSAPATVARDADLVLDVAPPVGFDQAVEVLLGNDSLALPPRSGPAPSAQVSITVPSGLSTGAKLLRVRVDGGESALAVDKDMNILGPFVTVT